MKRIAMSIVAAALLAVAQSRDDAERLLKAAHNTQLVDGDLNGAIKQYSAIVSKYKSDRAVVATALVRMAECYQKMGDAEARKIYEQVLRDYADQKEAVAEARVRLGAESGAAGMVNRRVWSGPTCPPSCGTSKPIVDTYGTVSPDGRSISHVNWHTGALAVYDIATGTDRDLTPDTSGKEDNAEESVISKDGRTVAYSWFNHETRHYELRLANLTGDPNPRRLYDNPDLDWIGPYDWSPDSKTIVAEVQRQDRTAQIALISAADGSIRVLKSIDWSGTGRIFFSPDGRFIGYDLPTPDNIRQHDVLVLGVDGSHETVAVRHPSLNFMMGWSPDGKWLLFASDRTGAMGLWAIAMVDGKPQGAAELIRPDVGWPESLGITRSGALYYSLATLGGEGSHIQTAAMDFETGKLLVPATDVTHPHGESDSQPFWSHNGKLMAYLAVRGRLGSSNAQNNGAHMHDNALAIRAADTGQLITELPLQLARKVQIVGWTADDRAVWLTGTNFKGKQGLFRVEIQSGEMTTVASAILAAPAANGPASPDGPTAFYRRVLGKQEVVFMSHNIASGEEKEIARGGLGMLNLSPDGKWICTPSVDRASNSRVLLLIPAAGGMPRTLMATPSTVPETELTNRRGAILNFVAWGPGMQWVLAVRWMADFSQPDELWRVPLDGGAARKSEVERGTRIPFYAGVSLAPDGTHLAFTISETTTAHTSEIWALENFLPRGGSK
jgi:Tol biopolymer transport system component